MKDLKERTDAIKLLAKAGEQKLSTNFLAAHGLNKEEGWASLSTEKNLMIMKLEKTTEEIGIKSP